MALWVLAVNEQAVSVLYYTTDARGAMYKNAIKMDWAATVAGRGAGGRAAPPLSLFRLLAVRAGRSGRWSRRSGRPWRRAREPHGAGGAGFVLGRPVRPAGAAG